MTPVHRSRNRRHALSLTFAAVALAGGCNSIFGISEGKVGCYDPSNLLIDDMEDGVGDICNLGGRHGSWFTVGDGTSTTLDPAQGAAFNPTLIPGGRGSSRYAARMTGSGFTDWGALMAFGLDGTEFASQTYNASSAGGIKFWMKSSVPVSVDFLTPATTPVSQGGECPDDTTNPNCNNQFSFQITAPSTDWTEYVLPFTALTQKFGGSATWNPKFLNGVQFLVGPGAAFDVWVDDVSFYFCATIQCVPTCADPAFPVVCPAGAGYPAACRAPGTVCSDAAGWCLDPLLIDDMEDGNRAICSSGGRNGSWFTSGDGTSTALSPLNFDFTQTLIPGGRDTSRLAAHLTGSGFSDWGASMGFYLNGHQGEWQPYDASQNAGIRFWLKSTVPVFVSVPTPETLPVAQGGTCIDGPTEWNCDNYFGFNVSVPSADAWTEYHVPFASLGQGGSKTDANGNVLFGSAAWNPSRVAGVVFTSNAGTDGPSPGAPFETWIDDVQFYSCTGAACVPTCSDPQRPVTCPASASVPASCWVAGTDCSSLPYFDLYRAWGSGHDVWAVGRNFVNGTGIIRHWNGSAWSTATSDTTVPLWSVWGSAPSHAWAVGDRGTIVNWDGSSSWVAAPTGTQAALNAVWGSGANDIWVAATPGTILHWDGTAWTTSTSVSGVTIWCLWGSGPDDVWAAGTGGTVMHRDASGWSTSLSGVDATFWGIWGSSSADIWAVGNAMSGAAALWHWDGMAWSGDSSSAVANPANDDPNAVWGSAYNNVWVVGDSILHWDGTSWSAFSNPAAQYLTSVWGSASNDVWAVGWSGATIHWDSTMWSNVPNGG